MKLALIGKNISHSRSPEIYKNLLGEKLSSYILLDYKMEKDIPTAQNLFLKFDGISITSPYKKHFLTEVHLVDCSRNIAGINCLRKKNNFIEGTNTDFLAIKEIILKLKSENTFQQMAILGDGVMSRVTELAFQELNLSYQIYSRRLTKFFDQLIFSDTLIINTCSRDYVFKGEIGKNVTFWDYNYDFFPHISLLTPLCKKYIDDHSLLHLQAKYALAFWSEGKL